MSVVLVLPLNALAHISEDSIFLVHILLYVCCGFRCVWGFKSRNDFPDASVQENHPQQTAAVHLGKKQESLSGALQTVVLSVCVQCYKAALRGL